ncbi:addiction module protein [Asticcacaulis sp. BYS171W]|uniref:Addiction module protein n=1 Tax=Asticcacaulis aquaticus TaxID=2984212 RepID=A0ABT5HPA3_9CAUL|nr:addiction module protein [Asticcacaulis aquaticus]MDC7681900.1 addiction module protein [Asticcacaulis aquaticus]
MNAVSKISISDLTVEERLELIEALWDSLEDNDLPVPEWHLAEIDRRMETFEQDKAQSVSWETIKAELERDL